MTKKRSPLLQPKVIDVERGLKLTTTIDDRGRHHISCDICGTSIPLTKTGHPHSFYQHREKCQRAREQAAVELRKDTFHHFSPVFTPNSRNAETVHVPTSRPISSLYSQMFSVPSEVPSTISRTSHHCPGFSVVWTAGSIWMTYPYHQHANRGLPWYPERFDRTKNSITFRSVTCTKSSVQNSICKPCALIPHSAEFCTLRDRAESPSVSPYMPFQYLTYQQQEVHMRNIADKLKECQIKLDSAFKRLDTGMARIDDYKRMTMLLASNNVVRLKQLISTSLRRRCSPSALFDKLTQSIKGLYTARAGFTARDIDISFLSKAIGGPRLLFSLQKAFGLVSDRTIKRAMKVPRLLVSIGAPAFVEISHNIHSFFNPDIRPSPTPLTSDATGLPGNVLVFDDIALESKCRYCPDRQMVMGLCREHSGNIDAKVTDLESLQKIQDALEGDGNEGSKKVCLGTNATVVCVAPYARHENYSPIPLVISPTDGKEKAEDLAAWIRVLIDTWRDHENGQRLAGEVWTLASDGDGTFRRARHLICTESSIEPLSPLGRKLNNLLGLNLHTSHEGITASSDPKHIMKRFRTITARESGFMIGQTQIHRPHLLDILENQEGMTRDAARALLDPADKQNVPKAVELIQRLNTFNTSSVPAIGPSSNRLYMVEFWGQFLGYFVLPFIDIEITLFKQLVSLTTFAHIAVVLWMENKALCMTSQIYADCQAVVKNVFITVARLQLIHPDHHYFLIHKGSDRLEQLFGDVRTMDHARNFDIRQLADKLAVATLINAAYERNPDLDRGHRRLDLKHGNALGIDRVNPKSWRGDTRVGDVDLHQAWLEGQSQASQVVERYLGAEVSEKYKFSVMFSRETGCDLLRPFGSNKWEGISNVQKKKKLPEDSAQPPIGDPDPADLVEDDNIEDSLPDTIDVGPATEQTSDNPSNCRPHTIKVKGQHISIDSLVSSLSRQEWKRVTMRTLRVQELTINSFVSSSLKTWLDSDESENNEVMKVGDIGAFPVRVNGKLSLAVLEVTEFRNTKSKHSTGAAKYTELGSPNSVFRIGGQILSLVESESVKGGWETLPATFVPTSSEQTRSSQVQYILNIPSIILLPLNPDLITSNTSTTHNRLRWLLNKGDLDMKWKHLWDKFNLDDPESVHVFGEFPEISESGLFPYRDKKNASVFTRKDLPRHLTFKPRYNRLKRCQCFICFEELDMLNMRNHVGRHILWEMRGKRDNSVKQKVGIEPCGFCGLDGCSLQLYLSQDGNYTVNSSCTYQYEKWNYKKAVTGSSDNPCTNVPIFCELCPRTIIGTKRAIWRYNTVMHAVIHHQQQHPTEPKLFVPPNLPGSMLVQSHISQEEEHVLGVENKLTLIHREDFNLPMSEDPIMQPEGLRTKRPRNLTISQVERQQKKKKD